MRRYLYAVAILVGFACMAASIAVADDYIDMLKSKVPGWEKYTAGTFAPMYEPLARQMVLDYKLKDGIAIEIGSSCSPFSIHLAKNTAMTVYPLDIDPWALRLLGVFVDEAELTGRVIPVEGDVQDMPFRDNFADFVFSRGSIPFWPDQAQGLREIYRVLKPGGVAYIGHGGFGRLLDKDIRDKLVEWRQGWGTKRQVPEGWRGPKEKMVDLAKQAGITRCRLIKEPTVGWWLEIRK